MQQRILERYLPRHETNEDQFPAMSNMLKRAHHRFPASGTVKNHGREISLENVTKVLALLFAPIHG
jgi:hypothetical protein